MAGLITILKPGRAPGKRDEGHVGAIQFLSQLDEDAEPVIGEKKRANTRQAREKI